MAGEYDDYKRAVENQKREDWRRWPWRRPPLKVRLLRSLPYVFSIALFIFTIVWFFACFGVSAGLFLLIGLIFVFVLIPLLCWLLKKYIL